MFRTPPFRALQGFVAVARHRSFSAAARDLCVSQSAVSHQIKLLEHHMGESLVYRDGKMVKLTRSGELLFPKVEGIMDELSALNQLFNDSDSKEIRVAANAGFATKLLMQRLPDFYERYPNIKVKLVMMSELFYKLTSDIADIFLTCNHQQRGYQFEILQEEVVVPICSPNLFPNPEDVTLDDLAACSLIDTDFHLNYTDWEHWSEVNQVPINQDNILISLNQVALAIEAATSGLGVALAWRPFVDADIHNGRLVELPLPGYKSGISYYVAHVAEAEDRAILCFKNWALEQFR